MPKYSEDKIFGHYLYFTSHCTVEAMHVHAGNEEMSEECSAKFFVKADGSSVMKRRGDLTRKEQIGIQHYIKKHYQTMYAKVTQIQVGFLHRKVTTSTARQPDLHRLHSPPPRRQSRGPRR